MAVFLLCQMSVSDDEPMILTSLKHIPPWLRTVNVEEFLEETNLTIIYRQSLLPCWTTLAASPWANYPSPLPHHL